MSAVDYQHLGYRPVVGQGIAQVASEQTPHIGEVLLVNGEVQPPKLAKLFPGLQRGCARLDHRRHCIATREPDGVENGHRRHSHYQDQVKGTRHQGSDNPDRMRLRFQD